jgi:hypothetical protein
MTKFINRKPVEVQYDSQKQGHVPIYDEQLRVWETVDTVIFAKVNEITTFTEDVFIEKALFIKDIDVEEHLLFRETGSFWNTTNNIGITGSFNVNLQEQDTLNVAVEGVTKVKINEEGVLVFTAFDFEPNPVSGGVYYSTGSEFFIGI